MRWWDTSLVACDYEVDLARVVRNFNIKADAFMFSGSECAHIDHVCVRTSHQVMRSFWATWLLFCKISKRLTLGSQNYQMAIIPRMSDIIDDVRLGGFKHQFEASCPSCAFGMSMPDGGVLSEACSSINQSESPKLSSNQCRDHAHAARCGIRRTCFTGLNTLVNVIAWDLRTASALSHFEHVEEVELSKCACAVRISLCPRQRQQKSSKMSRVMHHVVTKDVNLHARSRHTKESLRYEGKTGISLSSRMRRSNTLVTDFTIEFYSKLLTTGLDPSRACGLVAGLVCPGTSPLWQRRRLRTPMLAIQSSTFLGERKEPRWLCW